MVMAIVRNAVITASVNDPQAVRGHDLQVYKAAPVAQAIEHSTTVGKVKSSNPVPTWPCKKWRRNNFCTRNSGERKRGMDGDKKCIKCLRFCVFAFLRFCVFAFLRFF